MFLLFSGFIDLVSVREIGKGKFKESKPRKSFVITSRFENIGLGLVFIFIFTFFVCSVSVCFLRKCRGRKEN